MKAEPGYRDEQELHRLYHEEGMSQYDMAEHFGCSRKTIGNWMNRYDIEINPGEKIRQKLGTGEDHHTYTRETRQCENCGSDVIRRPSHFTGELAFCNEECQLEYTEGNHEWGPGDVYTDGELLEDLQRLEDELDRPPSFDLIREHGICDPTTYRRRFGSLPNARDAAGIEKHIPFERRGLRKYSGTRHPYGETWRENRRRRLEVDGYACVACGISEDDHRDRFGVGLTVHHVVPARKFDDLEDADSVANLVTMCSSCHRRWEGVPVIPEAA